MTRAREFIKGIAKETPAFEVNCVGIATTKKANMGPTKAIGLTSFPTVVNFALLKSAVGYEDDISNSNLQVARLNLDTEIIVSLS